MRINCIEGAEALVRWNHPQRGLLLPIDFIGLAEELGLIRAIGQWVMERAFRDAAAWRDAGLHGLKIAINVSQAQFRAGDLCACVRQALFDSGLPPALAVLEITESMLMHDIEAGMQAMREIRDMGVALSIDDFGTGYSSLSYLKNLPLNELKIDRSFVTDLPAMTVDVEIVRAVIGLGHSTGLSITAEGVETNAQLACLRQLGCDTYQGFLYSKPVPLDRFVELVVTGRREAVAIEQIGP